MATRKRFPKLKLTHHTHSQGGPWSTTDFHINGLHVGSLRTRQKSLRDQEIVRYETMDQDALRQLLRRRVSTIGKAIEEVEVLLQGIRHTIDEELRRLS